MALIERYVRADADGSGDGTTDANTGATGAFTWAQMISDINTPRVGYRYNVKVGTYSLGATSTITGDGSTTSPNIIRGFNVTPGDLIALRGSGGVLDVTNFPSIEYSSGFGLNATGATHLIIESLSFAGTIAGGLVRHGTESVVLGCKVVNSSSNASAIGIEGNIVSAQTIMCDVELPSGNAAAKGIASPGPVESCRVKVGAGIGISMAANISRISGNIIYECGNGIVTTGTTSRLEIFGNTIVNCTGSAIVLASGTTAQVRIISNHLTGNGAYGIDFNSSTCTKIVLNNRFRDNVLGNISASDDWTDGTGQLNITSDDIDSDDFIDQGNDDYTLKTTSAAYQKSIMYRNNIGAIGSSASAESSFRICRRY